MRKKERKREREKRKEGRKEGQRLRRTGKRVLGKSNAAQSVGRRSARDDGNRVLLREGRK